MSTWADEYITLIEDCEARSERLSDWEAQFLDSLRRQLEGRVSWQRASTEETK